MKRTLLSSDSVVGSLCREINFLRCRSKSIIENMSYTYNGKLLLRLNSELKFIRRRSSEIISITNDLFNHSYYDKTSLRLLLELSNRSMKEASSAIQLEP